MILLSRTIYPIALLIAVNLAATTVISIPALWKAIYPIGIEQRLDQFPDKKDTLYEDAYRISDALWTQQTYAQISNQLTIKKLEAKEQKHFEDVRFLLKLAAAISLSLFTLLIYVRKKVHWLTTWRFTGIYLLVFGAIFGIWTAISWRHMFRTLHWWIFQNDSWILPENCYTLFLYPYSVWQTAAVFLSIITLITITSGIAFTTWKKK